MVLETSEEKRRFEEFLPTTGSAITLGTSTQTVQFSFNTTFSTSRIVVTAESVSFTDGTNPSIISSIISNIEAQIGGRQVIRQIDGVAFDYIHHKPLIGMSSSFAGNGFTLEYESVNAISSDKNVGITLTLNTLANGTSGSPTACSFNLYARCYAGSRTAGPNRTYHSKVSTATGFTAGTPISTRLIRYERSIQALVLLIKSDGTLTDDLVDRIEVTVGSTDVIRLSAATAESKWSSFAPNGGNRPTGVIPIVLSSKIPLKRNVDTEITITPLTTDSDAYAEIYEISVIKE